MKLLTKILRRPIIAAFVPTNEGQRAFEDLQRDITNIWPQGSYLDNDVSNSTVALADTGLLGSLEPSAWYVVEADLTFQSAAVTTGIALAFDLPAGAVISGSFEHFNTSTAKVGSYNIASNAFKSATTGVLVANENVPLTGRWLIKNGATMGNANLRFASEDAASAVTLKGGLCALNFYRTL